MAEITRMVIEHGPEAVQEHYGLPDDRSVTEILRDVELSADAKVSAWEQWILAPDAITLHRNLEELGVPSGVIDRLAILKASRQAVREEIECAAAVRQRKSVEFQERRVLAAVLSSGKNLQDAVDARLLPEDFEAGPHTEIYAVVLQLFQEGRCATVETVWGTIERTADLKKAIEAIAQTPTANLDLGAAISDLQARTVMHSLDLVCFAWRGLARNPFVDSVRAMHWLQTQIEAAAALMFPRPKREPDDFYGELLRPDPERLQELMAVATKGRLDA